MSWKQTIKGALDTALGNRAAFALTHRAAQAMWGAPSLYIVNYHDTPGWTAAGFGRQMAFYADHFSFATVADLGRVLAGEAVFDRPGLLLTFDDGLRTNYDVAAPILDSYGAQGVFLVCPDLIESEAAATPEAEAARAWSHLIHAHPDSLLASDPRAFMTWAEVHDLEARGHVIGCHTKTHTRLSAHLSHADREREIPVAKATLEARLGHGVDLFCWVGGESESYSHSAAQAIRDAGFRYSLMTCAAPVRPGDAPLQLQRYNIESDWPLERVRLVLGGLFDVLYRRKRRYVEDLTRTA